jgi:hypothetical protein
MRSRFLTAAAALLAVALPAAAQAPKEKGPALTFQTLPPGKLLDDIKAAAKIVAGDDAVKEIDKHLTDALGEKGFTGVDMLRPVVGYAELNDKAEASGAVVVVPVTGEKDFLDLLDRLKCTVEEAKDARGLYRVLPPHTPQADPPALLRFKDRSAYLGFNVPAEKLAADKLVPPSALTLPADNAAFAYRLHLDRIPEGLRKEAFEAIDKAVAELKNMPGGGPKEETAKAVGEEFAKLVKRYGDQVLKEGDTFFVRVRLDPQAADVALEWALAARKGSQLVKDIAARKPSVNRFAGLLTDRSVGGFTFEAPLFSPEVRTAAATAIDSAADSVKKEDPPPKEYQPLFDEVRSGLVRTAKSGDFHAAGALNGPDADGFYTAAVAVSYEDAPKLEKVLRDLLKEAPEHVRGMVKLDVAKAGDVSIHRIEVPNLPPEARKVFGEKASAALAFAPKGVYVTFGPSAVEAMKAALAAKPAEAKALDLVLNPARVQKLAAAIDPQAGQMVGQVLGTDDVRLSVLSASVEGGDELRLRAAMSLKVIPRALGYWVYSARAAEPPPPAPVKK